MELLIWLCELYGTIALLAIGGYVGYKLHQSTEKQWLRKRQQLRLPKDFYMEER